MDFVILKVNGQDVSRSSHEDAVRAFQSADEPIVVEVLRRAQQTSASPVFVPPPPICCSGIKGNSIGGGSNASSPELVSTAVQTDWMGAWDLAASQEAFHTPPPHMYVIPEAEPDESYEDDYLGQEIMDYEEVTLKKSADREERLGLTLCYSCVPGEVDDDAPDTEVFISAIEDAGIAGCDGRLREGDQILQVNGIDVTTKEQAEALFASSNDSVTLLVTRPSSQQDFDEELEDNDCGCESTSFIQIPAAEFDDEGAACSSGAAAVSESASNPSHQDSGLGTDLGAECSHEEHRDFENDIDLAQATIHCTEERKYKSKKSKETNIPAVGSATQVVAEPGYLGSAETSPEDKRDCKEDPATEPRIKALKPAMTMIPAQRLDLIDHELYQLNKKMEIIQLECESIAAQHNPSPLGSTVVRPFGDPATEHIYETIPEQTESEAEPIYSLPYEPERVQTMQPVSKVKSRALRTCDPILKVSKQEDVEQWVKLTGTDSKSSKDGESWLKKEAWPHSVDSRSSSESRRRHNVDTTRSKSKNKCKDSSSGDDKEKDSSSAYNTGESCRSTPLTLELGMSADPMCGRSESTLVLCPPPPSASTEDRSMQVNLDSDTYSVISCESCRRCMRLPPLSPEQSVSPSASPKKTVREPSAQKSNEPEKNLNYVTMIPADTMYTNAANLQQTIWLQQQLFRQALVKQNHNRLSQSSTMSPKSPNPPAPDQTRKTMPACSPAGSYMAPNLNGYQFVSGYGVVNGQPTSCTLPSPQSSSHAGRSTQHQQVPITDAMQMEWKVKKRPDGSRYIARRPVRNRLLRDRAMKITEERAGVTTDDDAVSELKVGRYWTREERRKHVEKAKEKRKRQEAVIRGKMYPNKDVQEHGQLVKGEERASLSKKKQINIVELSHKKMARKKSANKDGFDDFTTVQEMLVHGNRVAPPVGPGGKMMGLLSVTTV